MDEQGPGNDGVQAPARRPPGRPRRSDNRPPAREAITAAAARLFMERGYRPVTVGAVAAAAGVTKAAVYYHFPDKASLLVAAARSIFEQARTATEAVLARPEPLRARLQTIATIVLDLPQPFTNFDTMMHEARADLSAEQVEEIRRHEEALPTLLRRAVDEAIRRGEIATDSPLLLTHAFLGLLRVGQARDAEGKPLFPDRARTARRLIDMLWAGIERG